MLQHFFPTIAPETPIILGHHDMGLVVLSIAIAIAMSLLALRMAETAKLTHKKLHFRITLGTGAVALGTGIWSMHFIGMFAFQLPAPVHYKILPTLLSIVPAIIAAWITLTLLMRHTLTHLSLLSGGVIMGAGIGTMHYSGMLAIETPLQMSHDLSIFLLSIGMAVMLAMLALWIRFGLAHTQLSSRLRFWISGIVMGSAIAAMHYTAMQAVQFHGYPEPVSHTFEINTFMIALAIAFVSLTIAMAVAAINGLIYSRELNRTINESKQRVMAVFNTAVDAIITINNKGAIHEFSPSAERMFGYSKEEVFGKNIKVLMPDPYHSEHDGYLARYMNTKIPHIIGVGREVIGKRKDGSVFPMRLSVGQANLPNDNVLFVGIITDITDRKQLEESLREQAEQAQQAAVAKSNFLANMSHEIRTPMNAIMGFTELLLVGELNATQHSHLNTIRQSSRSLLALLNDILDTSKLDSGKFDLETKDFSLKVLASQVESTLSLSAQNKNLHLNVHYPPSIPEFFVGDCLRILQVLTNLVGNAIKFTERGSIDVSFDYTNEQVHIQVSDTGIGMSPKQLASVFEAFSQADASISRRFGGTGLGTTISRQLVEAMNGYIEAESELGIGTTFHVWLPLKQGKKPQETTPHETIELPPMHILVVDDIEQNRELLSLTLHNRGHRITLAKDGQEAFDLATSDTFDLVLMDVHMPKVDGLQATQMIREHEHRHQRLHLPIIALTASVLASDRKVALKAGMDGFAVKPLDIPQLFNEISRVISDQPTTESHLTESDLPRLAIDWERGSQLWGNTHILATKITEFLSALPEIYPLPTQLPEEGRTLQFSLHGMKGAAGNLGLMKLAEIAGHLETFARTERWPQLLNSLPELHAHLKALQADEQLQHLSAPTASHTVNETEQPTNTEALLSHLQIVRTQLEHSELNDESLKQLSLLLSAAHAQQLQTLVDNFDFEQACALLEDWQNTLTTHAL